MKLLVLTATALFAFAAGSCQAVPIYFTGFDNPPFTLGPINGQAGWFVFSASCQTSDPVIENTVVQSGLQAVGVDGFVTGQTGPVWAPNLTLPVFDMSADIFLGSGSSQSEWQFASTGAGGIGFAGGIDIHSDNSIVAITGNYATVLGTWSRDVWHHVDLLLNYSSQTYSVVLDGTTIGFGLAFCGNNFGTSTGAPVTTMSWDLFDSFGNGNDFGAIDNFSISTPVCGTDESGPVGQRTRWQTGSPSPEARISELQRKTPSFRPPPLRRGFFLPLA